MQEKIRNEEMDAVLATLPHRERKVIELRYGLGGEEPMTLEEVGRVFGITRERVRQIENRTLMRLKSFQHAGRLRDIGVD